MTWINALPSEPGRYWFRETRPLNPGEPPRFMYGIALVKWKPLYSFDVTSSESKLEVRSHAAFDYGGGMGEAERDGGWSGGAGRDLHPGLEFWDEPLVAPPGLTLPPLPPRPVRTEAEQAALVAQQKNAAKLAAKKQVAARSELEERIEKAYREEDTLYECECEEVISYEDLVEVRECSKCDDEARFNGDDNGRNCPTCNRTFSRNLGKGSACCFVPACEMTVLVQMGAVTDAGKDILSPPKRKAARR